MSDKLPEWPEKPRWDDRLLDKYHYQFHRAEAALARMEALVEYARHPPGCRIDAVGLDCGTCTCGLSELLAACEKRKS